VVTGVLRLDVRLAGAVLSGGLAYRLFFWTLSLAVLAAGGLGFAAERTDVAAEGRRLSMGEEMTRAVADAARQSANGRWWLLLTGSGLVIWFAWSLMRSLRLAHAAAWGVPPGRALPHPVRILGILSVPVALVAVTAVTGLVRHALGPLSGVAAFVVSTLALTALAALGAARLPSPPGIPWSAHLPGAAALVLAVQAANLGAQVFLADRLASSEQLYGTLGLGATLLFALYLFARGTVWAFELNAVLWRMRTARAAPATTAG
jgi:uncharacterized BrkB/YihY/UPF0761 family membrane protein